MSISFTCLFLVYIIYHYLVYFLRKEKQIEPIYFSFCSLVLCVRVFLKETCVEKKREKKGDGIPCMFFFCVYVFMALDFSVDFFFFFFRELLLCSRLCFLFFFMLPLLLPPPLFSFIYLLSDCVCVCVSFYYRLCVCVRACSSLILFCCFSVFFFFSFIKKLPNLFTT
jgi:hypothetical protein